MKILVAIANYGTKNQQYLTRLIDEYKSMPFDIDIVLLSNIPKELGPDVEVLVGLPSKNPWSLPFSHKKIFVERAKDYDLFIYSEDDTLITKRNIEAFLKVTKVLPADEIAGFLRYEEDTNGKKYCSSIHSHFHWVPTSVKSLGGYTFAYFTNEHSACYILTREQLQKAIESGGYLVNPHEGRYDLLCTAATDPYTQCGFTKVVCISHIDNFLLHHLPNQYVGKMGIEFDEMAAQIRFMLAMNGNKEAPVQLFSTRTKLNKSTWDKLYYEKCRDDILAIIPSHCKKVLSIGCGWGATEAKLVQSGVQVMGIPLDPIIAESTKRRGIQVLPPDFERAKQSLSNQKFDCILLSNVMQHLRYPKKILKGFTDLLDEKSCVIITIPNFKFVKYFYTALKYRKAYKNGEIFDKTRLHLTTHRMTTGWLSYSGLNVSNIKYNTNKKFRPLVWASLGLLTEYLAREIVFVAKKT